MDDNIYSSLMSRTHKDSDLYSQLSMFSDHYSLVDTSQENRT